MSVDEQRVLEMAYEAARAGDNARLLEILEASPEVVTYRTATDDTLLGLACRSATGDVAIPPVPGTKAQHQAVDLILEAGADVNAATTEAWTPLHTAAMAGHLDLARRLLEAGASTSGSLYQCQGGSPLALALFYAKTEVGRRLAKPTVPDNLRHAAALGQDLNRFFAGGEFTASAKEGLDFYRPLLVFPKWDREFSRQEVLDEALTWAARNGQCKSMAWLVRHGAGVDSNAYRGTPLLWAIYSSDVQAATWLLDHGADPNLRHDFGGQDHGLRAVALHLAAQHDSVDCVKLLLNRGANPHIVDGAHGGDALGWAEFSGATRAVEVLKKWTGTYQ